jgi:hypothetical protein
LKVIQALTSKTGGIVRYILELKKPNDDHHRHIYRNIHQGRGDKPHRQYLIILPPLPLEANIELKQKAKVLATMDETLLLSQRFIQAKHKYHRLSAGCDCLISIGKK